MEFFVTGFSYVSFFEQDRPADYDGPIAQTAIRVQALDDTCRELGRKYISPIGYGQNNMFTSDWSEEDFQDINLYDLYDTFYTMKYGSVLIRDDGISYDIPKADFEAVFQTFLNIDSQALQERTVYRAEDDTYRFRPRGMFDLAVTANIPYPEVVSYEENPDGTFALTVNAVWPKEKLEKAFSHVVVIRSLEDGGFQYVSNRVIPSEDNVEPMWYADRLTDEEWEEYFGNRD